jgi:hypothetical protein
MTDHIIYLALGKPSYIEEAIASITSLSILKDPIPENFAITIYTDQPQRFSPLADALQVPVYTHYLSEEQLDEWKGTSSYVLLLKIKAMIHHLSTVGGKMLFVDTDTYFTKNPYPLFGLIDDMNCVMHMPEYHIDSKLNQELYHDLVRSNTWHFEDVEYTLPLDTLVWNSGVTGLQASHLPILEESARAVEGLSLQLPNQAAVDQIVMSYFLGENLTIHESEQYITHYWFMKAIRYLLLLELPQDRFDAQLQLQCARIRDLLDYRSIADFPIPAYLGALFQTIYPPSHQDLIRSHIPESMDTHNLLTQPPDMDTMDEVRAFLEKSQSVPGLFS